MLPKTPTRFDRFAEHRMAYPHEIPVLWHTSNVPPAAAKAYDNVLWRGGGFNITSERGNVSRDWG